jgi:nucleoside-diphosphate-sugar epimerase
VTTVLITGISTSIGKRLGASLSMDNSVGQVVGVDTVRPGSMMPRFRFIESDVDDFDIDSVGGPVDVLVVADPEGLSTAGYRRLLVAAENAGVRSAVVVSTTAVFGAWESNSVPLTDNSPLRPNHSFPMIAELAERERVTADWRLANPKMKVAILRLGMLVDDSAEVPTALARTDWHTDENNGRLVQFLHIDDAVTAIVTAAKEELDGAFNAAPPDFLAVRKAREVAGVTPRPALPRVMATVFNELQWRKSKYESGYGDFAHYLKHPWVVSSEALTAAGWVPAYSTADAVAATAVPNKWHRLRPRHKRALVGAALGSGVAVGVGAIGAIAVSLRRR